MIVKVKKINDKAMLPIYQSDGAAGADLYSCGNYKIPAGETVMIQTGICVEIPQGCVGLIYARSGLAVKEGLAPANKVGVIDCDYRGEIKVALYNQSGQERSVCLGERVAQLVITPYIKCEFSEEEISLTERGEGGFGSTGKL